MKFRLVRLFFVIVFLLAFLMSNLIILEAQNQNDIPNKIWLNIIKSTCKLEITLYNSKDNKKITDWQGSGENIYSDKQKTYILTAYHLIPDFPNTYYTINVKYTDNKIYTAYIINGKEEVDCGILVVKQGKLPAITISDNYTLIPGQYLESFGWVDNQFVNLYHHYIKIHDITANDKIRTYYFTNQIICQYDVINGMSGGGLYNVKGEMLGIVSNGNGFTSRYSYSRFFKPWIYQVLPKLQGKI